MATWNEETEGTETIETIMTNLKPCALMVVEYTTEPKMNVLAMSKLHRRHYAWKAEKGSRMAKKAAREKARYQHKKEWGQ